MQGASSGPLIAVSVSPVLKILTVFALEGRQAFRKLCYAEGFRLSKGLQLFDLI